MHSISQFLLQMNLGALLTASLAHTSFEKCKIMLSQQKCSVNSECGCSLLDSHYESLLLEIQVKTGYSIAQNF